MKVLFLNLDRIIRRAKSGSNLVNNPLDIEAIEGAKETLNYYYQNNWEIIGLTNQEEVMLGVKSLKDCIQEQQMLMSLFPAIWKIYVCPDDGHKLLIINPKRNNPSGFSSLTHHHPSTQKCSNFRQPGTGMIDYHRQTHLPLTDTLLVGDTEINQQCAIKANIPFLNVQNWLNIIPSVD